jgi:RluA family pseudouridine synthase
MSSAASSLDCADLLYYDSNLYVFNKHIDVSVIPGRGEDTTLSLRSQVERVTNEKIFVVHRIDRGTSGIVVFTRNRETHRLLCTQFENRTVHKEYWAVVSGQMHNKGVIDKPIYQFGSGRMGVDKRGKRSITEFKVIETTDEFSLLQVLPRTGRRHQIRVHLYNAGHPIVGDPLYGSSRPVYGCKRLMLHAAKIVFTGIGGKEFTFEAPVDNEWDGIMQNLRNGMLPDRNFSMENCIKQ